MITIRPVHLSDIKGIQHVARSSWMDTYREIYPIEYIESFLKQAYSADQLEQSIIRDQQLEARRFLVAVSAETEELAGYVHVMKENDECYELLRVYLLPSYQGTGIGTSLLNEVSTLNQISHLKAWVEEQNLSARRFYEAKGFIIVGEEIEKNEGFTTKLLCYDNKKSC